MLDPSVQVDIHRSKSSQCKPLHGASGLVFFDAIVFEEPFMASFDGGTCSELLFESIRAAGYMSNQAEIVFGL